MCKVSFITINYNGLADTCALIDTIPVSAEIEVVVVDNASREDEASTIKHRYPHVNAVRSEQNLGFAGGNNLGIKAAHGRYLFFVNNDTVFRGSDTEKLQGIQDLIHRLESSDSCGLVCPKIRFSWGDAPIQFTGYTPLSAITMRNSTIGLGEDDHGQYDTPHPTPYAHGAAMLTRRDIVEKIGTMPECYFLYYEELDWSLMFQRAGYAIWYDPSLTIYHKESQSTGQNSPLRAYYMTRNRLMFARRNIIPPKKYLTYLYLLSVVGLRDLVKYAIKGRFTLVGATLSGIGDFVRGKEGFRQF